MSVRILVGDVRERLRDLPDRSVHCVVTSPPYFGLRDYGVDRQMGLETTPEEYIANMVEAFREVRRVLRDDGTLWLNIGDSYANDEKWGGSTGGKHASALHGDSGIGRRKLKTGLKGKDLIGIPWLLAFALRADGWYLRQEIIWAKKNVMPESVRDRCTKAHEQIFLLSKAQRYYFDAEAVKEPVADSSRSRQTGLRNKRSVWYVATKPFKEAHFATFPPDLIEPCILAGTSEAGVCTSCGTPWQRQHIRSTTTGWAPGCGCEAQAGPATVLDPFFGAGTTGLVADRLRRDCIGIELNPEYAEIARRRIDGESGMFTRIQVAV